MTVAQRLTTQVSPQPLSSLIDKVARQAHKITAATYHLENVEDLLAPQQHDTSGIIAGLLLAQRAMSQLMMMRSSDCWRMSP
jgi:hypothetical protein